MKSAKQIDIVEVIVVVVVVLLFVVANKNKQISTCFVLLLIATHLNPTCHNLSAPVGGTRANGLDVCARLHQSRKRSKGRPSVISHI